MSNLREAYASTHHSSLEWSPERERAIDRVAASGRCDELGVLLWKAKYGDEDSAKVKVKVMMNLMIRWKFKHHADLILSKVVDQAMKEFMEDWCETCGGRGEIKAGELKIVCHVCTGSKVRRYSDAARAKAMDLSPTQVAKLIGHGRPFGWLANEITVRDRAVNIEMCKQLERIYLIFK